MWAPTKYKFLLPVWSQSPFLGQYIGTPKWHMNSLYPLEDKSRYILVIGDYFTKWKEAFPLRDMEATSIARVLVNEFICHFGVLILTKERTSAPNW